MERVLLMAVLLPLSMAVGAVAPPAKPVTVAVGEFRSYYSRVKREFADRIIADLAKDPRISVLDRGQLDKVLAEQALDLSRDLDPGTAALVGRLTGAAIIVTGILSTVQPDETYSLRVRITGTSTGRALIEDATGHRFGTATNDRAKVAAEVSRKIVNAIFAHAADLMGPARESREARIAAIVAAMPPGRRPTVSLHFTAPESVNGLPPSATVETELGLILQRAGFVVLDGKSKQKSEFEIVGDVIADAGAKLGNLFPGRAVINARVRQRDPGKILLIERQAADAMDLGEQTALSAAIEKAADALAARLVPLLSQ
jgi:hypothetical protein